ncbi:MAG: hypothetical protein K1Y36_06915 [Blastocatellia bacterium]|nr:hypothetical protein [Blastocatellia bacterium]
MKNRVQGSEFRVQGSGLLVWAVLLLVGWLGTGTAAGQRQDALNEQEVERVREAQEIDLRTQVFLKIADRRLTAIEQVGQPQTEPTTPPVSAKEAEKERKKKSKEEEQWGPPPTGTRLQLLIQYVRVLDELEDKLDDVFERNPAEPRLLKACENLKTGTEANLTRLKKLQPSFENKPLDEKRIFERAVDLTTNAHDGAVAFLSKREKK